MIRISSPTGVVIRHGRPRVLATILASLLLVAGLPSAPGLAQPEIWGARSEVVEWGPSRLPWLRPAPLDPDLAERLFTAYDAGQYADFDRLADTLASSVINPFELEADAERWMEAATDRQRRAFVAAAVALELASRSTRQEPTAVELRFTLAELGCTWLRDHPPLPGEQAWHAAFVALARATRREDHVIAMADPRVRRARLAGWPEREIERIASRAARESRAHEDAVRNARAGLLTRLRRESARSSGSTRIDIMRATGNRTDLAPLRGLHGRHLLARFPDDPHPLFLEAIVRERQRVSMTDRLVQVTMADTLMLDGRYPVWLDAAAVERIAAGGAPQVRDVPVIRRMDRASAERLVRIAPELDDRPGRVVVLAGRMVMLTSPAFKSLMLWDLVEAFESVPAGDPVAAETALRLGQNYVRLARPDLALPAFARAESLATSPYELYLARVLAGAVFARLGYRTEAIVAFEGALVAAPRAQSASLRLAPLLVQVDAQAAAAEILEAAMALPLADDPLHAYYTGDATALSRALARLREEARR